MPLIRIKQMTLATTPFLILAFSQSQAATIYPSTSCNYTDVTSALNLASSGSGEVLIQLPPCNVTWNSAITINTASGWQNVTAITLQGAGSIPATGSAGQTVITNNSGSAFTLISSPQKKIRVSNLTLKGIAKIDISGTGRPGNGGGWRIDHITSYPFSERTVWVEGYTYGVIDHSDFRTSMAVVIGIRENVNSDGGNSGWARGPSFGTAEAVYVEDNYIEYVNTDPATIHMCIDSEEGGRYVFRHNETQNCYAGTHDLSSLGNGRSAYSWEVYNNRMHTTGNYSPGLIGLRGGTGYVYNNDFLAINDYPFYAGAMILTNYRSFGYASASPWTTSCSPTDKLKFCIAGGSAHSCSSDADCNGVAGSCVYADDPSGDGSDYPCRDQIGRITSAMTSRPALFWNNRLFVNGGAGIQQSPSVSDSGLVPQHIKVNRDYCEGTAMPSLCNGVATTYTPFVYPHPLVSSTPSSPVALLAPKNLRLL